MKYVLIILLIAVLVVVFSKNVQRYLLFSVLNWFARKVSKSQQERMNNYRRHNNTEERSEEKSNKVHKVDMSDISKRKFETKSKDQYVEYEEIK